MIIIAVDVIDAVVAVIAVAAVVVVVVADEAVPQKILGRQEFQNLPIFESLTHWLKIVSKMFKLHSHFLQIFSKAELDVSPFQKQNMNA